MEGLRVAKLTVMDNLKINYPIKHGLRYRYMHVFWIMQNVQNVQVGKWNIIYF